MSYYGCTATGHGEHTCLSAYYTGPRRFRRIEAWCPTCQRKYRHPEGFQVGRSTPPKGNGMNQKDAALVAAALRSSAGNETAMRAAGIDPARAVALADEFSPSVED